MTTEPAWGEMLSEAYRSGVSGKIRLFVKESAPIVDAYLEIENRPACDFLWYNPETKTASFKEGEEFSQVLPCFAKVARHQGDAPDGFGSEAWMPIKMAEGAFKPLFSAAQLAPNPLNRLVGGPTPLAASLAGSLMGSALGYGAGWVGEKLMGERVLQPGKLRRNAAILGGLVGAAPGAYLGSVGMRDNSAQGKNPWRAWIEPEKIFGAGPESGEHQASAIDPGFKKAANEAGALFMPMIPVDSFNRTVWEDPSTPMGVRTAVTGLVEGASQSRGGLQMVSPFDVTRIAVGMGSGLLSGLLVGKALGALAGLTPDAQRTLQRTGMWAGALSNIVPQAFGFGG